MGFHAAEASRRAQRNSGGNANLRAGVLAELAEVADHALHRAAALLVELGDVDVDDARAGGAHRRRRARSEIPRGMTSSGSPDALEREASSRRRSRRRRRRARPGARRTARAARPGSRGGAPARTRAGTRGPARTNTDRCRRGSSARRRARRAATRLPSGASASISAERARGRCGSRRCASTAASRRRGTKRCLRIRPCVNRNGVAGGEEVRLALEARGDLHAGQAERLDRAAVGRLPRRRGSESGSRARTGRRAGSRAFAG